MSIKVNVIDYDGNIIDKSYIIEDKEGWRLEIEINSLVHTRIVIEKPHLVGYEEWKTFINERKSLYFGYNRLMIGGGNELEITVYGSGEYESDHINMYTTIPLNLISEKMLEAIEFVHKHGFSFN